MIGLPVAGVVCPMACDAALSPMASHHHAGQGCEPRSSGGSQMSAAVEHDCGTHDATVRPVATTAAERADATTALAPATAATLHTTVTMLPELRFGFERAAPPDAAPPTTTPLVLRA